MEVEVRDALPGVGTAGAEDHDSGGTERGLDRAAHALHQRHGCGQVGRQGVDHPEAVGGGHDQRVARRELATWKGRQRSGPVVAGQPWDIPGLNEITERAAHEQIAARY